MENPVILTIDDEPQVLKAIERDLRDRYHKDYRILKANSGMEGMDLVKKMKQRGMDVALFLVDHRMPQMNGTEFLTQAMTYYPEAKKVLLTAYADTDAAIDSINKIGLDYYLLKPWSPPEQHMYPVLDDLLSEWQTKVRPPFQGIRVVGTQWSAKSHDVKDFLARNRIPYQWLDLEKNAEAKNLIETVENPDHQLPVIFFPEGKVLIAPENKELASTCGLQTEATAQHYDLIIVGGGPAGLAAAVYGASEGLHTLLIDEEATGGQAGTSSRIENYLGFPAGVSGMDLANRATVQAKRLGAEILTAQRVVKIKRDDPYRLVVLQDGTELSCKALILSTGVTLRKLDIPNIDRLSGAGIYYGAAVSEAAQLAGEQVYIVGGANSAGQGAMFLSRYAAKVTMLIRGESLQKGMSQYLIDQIDNTENIEVLTHTTVEAVKGEKSLEGLTLKNGLTGVAQEVPAAAMFIFIGARAHTDVFQDVIACDVNGFILTGTDLALDGDRPKGWQLNRDPFLNETSVPGIFAAGDVRAGVVRRVASAVGQGSVTVSFVHEYLKTV
ncbi:MAG: FAD-dependent oxidoreductase [Bacteroidota bacterium]